MKEHSYIPTGLWHSLPNMCIIVSLLQDFKIEFLSIEAEELIEWGGGGLPQTAGFVLLHFILLSDGENDSMCRQCILLKLIRGLCSVGSKLPCTYSKYFWSHLLEMFAFSRHSWICDLYLCCFSVFAKWGSKINNSWE